MRSYQKYIACCINEHVMYINKIIDQPQYNQIHSRIYPYIVKLLPYLVTQGSYIDKFDDWRL